MFVLAVVTCMTTLGCTPTEYSPTTEGSFNAEASSDSDQTKKDTAADQTGTTTPVNAEAKPTGAGDQNRMPKDGEDVAVMKTNLGTIVIMFFPEVAPNHVARFKEAIAKDIYVGTKFHRVIPGFMIQGGDPNSKDDDRNNDGSGGWGAPMKSEFNSYKHVRGVLSAARTNDPNSATSQFFLVHDKASFLDNQYTVYGRAVEGLEVIDKIVNLKRDARDNPLPENPAIIESLKLEKWPIKKG